LLPCWHCLLLWQQDNPQHVAVLEVQRQLAWQLLVVILRLLFLWR
jgi:hypothetical protein